MSTFFEMKSIKMMLIAYFMLPISVAFSEPTESKPPTLSPITQSPELTNSPEYVVIQPSDQVTFSSEAAASIANIPLKEGSKFQKDDILLQLDCRLQKAELKKALAQQSTATIANQSAKKLKSYGSISEFEYIKSTSDAEIANAEVDRLNAIVDKCTIKAPFNGAIAELMVHTHESVKPGDPLLKIVNTDNLEFEIQVPSCWLQWLHVGSTFQVQINETKQIISAEVSKINPQIEPVSQSVKLVATIPDTSNLIPGMSGQAIFEKGVSSCKSGKT